jgi:hypothetical protein
VANQQLSKPYGRHQYAIVGERSGTLASWVG